MGPPSYRHVNYNIGSHRTICMHEKWRAVVCAQSREQPSSTRASPSHSCNYKFTLEPCGGGILQFCHDMDIVFSYPLLDLFGTGEGVCANE